MRGAEVTGRAATTPLPVMAVLLSIVVHLGCFPANARYENKAFADFVTNYWGPDLFSDECTGLEFDSAAPLTVFSRAPGFKVTLLDLAALAPIDAKRAAAEEGGLQALAEEGASEGFSGPVDISAYSFARPSDSPEPKDEWQPADGYLLRFSNRVHFRNHVYLQIWIKASRTSSGARIDYEFDEAGQLLRSRKQSRRCDDWG